MKFKYLHEDVKAYTMKDLINYLNDMGNKGWVLVSHQKSDKPGYASIILIKSEI